MNDINLSLYYTINDKKNSNLEFYNTQQKIDLAEKISFLEEKKNQYQAGMDFLFPKEREKMYDFIEEKMREDYHFVDTMIAIYDKTSGKKDKIEREKVLLKLKKEEKKSIQNFRNAFTWIRQEISKNKEHTPHPIPSWSLIIIHSKLAAGFDDINPGMYRTSDHLRPVVNGMIAPEIHEKAAIATQVEKITQYANLRGTPASERAFEALYNLVLLQPFLDRNKRSSLMFANLILMNEGYPPLFLDASNKDECVYAMKDYRDTGSPKKYYAFMFKEYKNSINLVFSKLDKLKKETEKAKIQIIAHKISKNY